MTKPLNYAILACLFHLIEHTHMSNKIKQFIYQLGFVLGFMVLFFPSLVDASAVNADTVIKAAGNPNVYYVATNGKRYRFPDPATFTTWYQSFGVVKEIQPDQFKQIPDGVSPITSRPGAKLITFKGSNRVYVVLSGAFIRWVKKEKIAEQIYGKNWQKEIVEIPLDQVNQYVIAQPINNAAEYNAFLEREKNLSPNAELAHRGLVSKEDGEIKKPAPVAEPVVLLSEMKTDLRAKLSPKFNPYTYSYSINAAPEEQYAGITVKAKDASTAIFVNGVPTPSGSFARLVIDEGSQIITINAIGPNGNSTIYTINIYRAESAPENAHLASLTENVSGNFEPAFNSNHFEYTLYARYPEEILRLTPKSASKNAIIKIDGVQVGSGATYDSHLPKGESKMIVSVRDGERSISYTIIINHQAHLSDDLAKLKELTTELKTIGRGFDPEVRDYHLDVDKNRTSITVSAKALDKNARVFINDVQTNKSTEKLYSGETRITIVVISSEGAKVTYRLFVNRVL